MILHSVVYRHPQHSDHIEVFHATKELADKHERQLKHAGATVHKNVPVEIPTDQGREALAHWLNQNYILFPDHLSKIAD